MSSPASIAHSRQAFIEELKDALIAADILIFGSAVSIGYRAKYHENEFFKKMEDNYYFYYKDEYYDNMLLYPEHIGRFDTPGDIDCFVSEVSQDKILNMFRNNSKFYVAGHKNSPTNKNKYMGNTWVTSKVKLVTFTVRPGMPEYMRTIVGTTLDVNIDFVYGMGDAEPPLTSIDFRCNALILSKHGYRVSKAFGVRSLFDQQKLLQEVLGEIIEKKAIRPKVLSVCDSNQPAQVERIRKMFGHGWLLLEPGCETVKPCNCEDGGVHKSSCYHSDVCCICCDSLTQDTITRDCCSMFYHSGCYMALRKNTDECPGCRNPIM